MGYRISWIARRSADPGELLDALELAATGECDEFLDTGWYLLEPRDDWRIVIADGSDYYGELEPEDAEELSKNARETVFFTCSDTVMHSDVIAYRDGKRLWSIAYRCDDAERPSIEGDAPAFVLELERAVRRAQQVEDETENPADILYSLPARVGAAMTGFDHDPWPQPEEDPFEGMFQILRPK